MPTAAGSPNPFRTARQRDKGNRVARRIWAELTHEQRTNPQLPATVAAMTEDERFGWAIETGVPVLSDESWAIAVEQIQERVDDERHFWGDRAPRLVS